MPRSSGEIIRELLRKFHFELSHDTRHNTYTLFNKTGDALQSSTSLADAAA